MCGRLTQRYTWDEVRTFLSVFGPPRNLRPHYNVAPTMTVDTICRGNDGRRELVCRCAGASSPPGGPNRRRKCPPRSTPARNPSPTSRCSATPLRRIAASSQRAGFMNGPGDKGNRQPHLFTAADGSPILAFADLCDRWRDRAAGEDILSCTIIVWRSQQMDASQLDDVGGQPLLIVWPPRNPPLYGLMLPNHLADPARRQS